MSRWEEGFDKIVSDVTELLGDDEAVTVLGHAQATIESARFASASMIAAGLHDVADAIREHTETVR